MQTSLLFKTVWICSKKRLYKQLLEIPVSSWSSLVGEGNADVGEAACSDAEEVEADAVFGWSKNALDDDDVP